MKSYILWMLIILSQHCLGLNTDELQDDITNDSKLIQFNYADLAVDLDATSEDNYFESFHLEAYKSMENDLIIKQTNDSSRYGQLNWYSIGYPKLLKHAHSESIEDQNNYLIFNNQGFHINVQMLTNVQRDILLNVVKEKYPNVANFVKSKQILNLILAKFKCNLIFRHMDQDVLLTGNAKYFTVFPLKVFFKAPIKSMERSLLEKKIKEDKESNKSLDISFECELNTREQRTFHKQLILKKNQMKHLGFIDELFTSNDQDFVYVTRAQLNSLASKLYVQLDIMQQYQMSLREFSDSFVEDFIRQVSYETNQEISFRHLNEDSVKFLSGFDLESKLKSLSLIKRSLAIFQISDELIFFNSTRLVHNGIFEIFGLEHCVNFVQESKNTWRKENKSVEEQVHELNIYPKNLIEWSFDSKGEDDGATIELKPVKMKVFKLTKRLFDISELVFPNIKFEYVDASFKRNVTLNTFNLDESKYKSNIYETMKSLKKDLDENLNLYDKIDKYIQLLANDLYKFKNNESDATDISQLNSSLTHLNEKLNAISGKINKIQQFIGSKLSSYHQNTTPELIVESKSTLDEGKLTETFKTTESKSKIESSTTLSVETDEIITIKSMPVPTITPLNNIATTSIEITTNKLNILAAKSQKSSNDSKIEDDEMKKTTKNFTNIVKRKVQGHAGRVLSLLLLSNGDLVSGSRDNTIIVWNSTNMSKKKTLLGHNFAVTSLAVLPNGELVSSSIYEPVFLWNITEGNVRLKLKENNHVHSLAVFANNSDLACGSANGKIFIWDTIDGKIKKRLKSASFSTVISLLVLSNGDLVSGSSDGTLVVMNIKENIIKLRLDGHATAVKCLLELKNGNLVSGSLSKEINIWNLKDGILKSQLNGHTGSINSVVMFSNEYLVSGSDDNSIVIWNATSGFIKAKIEDHNGFESSLVVLPNDDLASGAEDNSINIWSYQ